MSTANEAYKRYDECGVKEQTKFARYVEFVRGKGETSEVRAHSRLR